jgi:hypothetical protein
VHVHFVLMHQLLMLQCKLGCASKIPPVFSVLGMLLGGSLLDLAFNLRVAICYSPFFTRGFKP